MHIEIRSFRSDDDLDALTALIHRAYAPHLARGLRYWATHQSAADTEKRLRSGLGLILLVDGRYAGTVTVCPPQPESPVPLYRQSNVRALSQFCVAPEHQGRGLGLRLHDYALSEARRSGGELAALDTAKPATDLIRLYQTWGYEIVGECDWRPDTNYLSVVMARQIPE
jgi:GNAT superfamily N-acetyltransferase